MPRREEIMTKTRTRAKPVAEKETPFDCSRVGRARREAIGELDEYSCTVAEQRAAFRVSEATFYRWAFDTRLRRRPATRPSRPPWTMESLLGMESVAEQGEEEPAESVMPASDALEIATRALLASHRNYSVPEIVEALNTSKSAVYRLKTAPTVAASRWRHRDVRVNAYETQLERRYNAARKWRCWKHGPRGSAS